MSHKSTIKMKISDRDTLLEALKHMGIKYEVAEAGKKLQVESRFGVKADVDVKLTADAKGHSMKAVGFRKNSDNSYEAVGDFYEISGATTKDGQHLSESTFKSVVSRRYSYFKAINELSKLGFSMDADVQNFGGKEVAFSMVSGF